MIKPTIGRVVLVYPGNNSSQWRPATVCWIHDTGEINVGGLDPHGNPWSALYLPLLQGDIAKDPIKVSLPEGWDPSTAFACWMPYQRQAQARENERAAQVRPENDINSINQR